MIAALSAGIGDKAASLSIAYGAAAVLALMLLVFSLLMRTKERWFIGLFCAIAVVNVGYFCMALSRTLEQALMANRISYLGSVFLPMVMLRILLKTAGVRWSKWASGSLLVLALAVFFVTATPGWLDIYYAQVSFRLVNGVGTLVKVYGSWHVMYLFYLVGYFLTMIAVAVWAVAKKRLNSVTRSVVLLLAVFVNLIVWLLEQLIKIDFEILSVSYIISGLALLGLDLIIAENERLKELVTQKPAQQPENPPEDLQLLQQFREGLQTLTPTEKTVYKLYVQGLSTAQVLEQMGIKENTLKFHNKNIYGKLGVTSRKQLLQLQKKL